MNRGAMFNTTNPLMYIIDFARYECIEYLEKKGYTKLVDAKLWGHFSKEDYKLINFKAKSKKELFAVDPQLLAQFKPQELFLSDLQLISKFSILLQKGFKINDIIALVKLGQEPERILWLLDYVTPQKLFRYIGEQGCDEHRDVRSLVQMYADYIRSARALHYDLSRKENLLPRDLVEAHDTVTKIHASQKDGILNENIVNVALQMDIFSFSDKHLLIRPVKDHAELVNEGIKLHHCVGSYAERISRGETTIFVIRRKSAQDEPFCTLELDPKTLQIVQCRGMRNCKPPREVDNFLEKWTRNKLRKANRVKIAV